MGLCVCGGATINCTFGMAPSVLNVLPTNKVINNNMPIANIMDHKPIVNILPFGMCNSISNPTVAAATAAALGVLTPMPCIPNVVAPWTPGSSTVLIGNVPALNESSQVICMWGGVIKLSNAGQFSIMVP